MRIEERNYGCRYQEISIYGYRALILENELLRITILIDRGCEIVEFNYKKTDTDLAWRTPKGLKCLKYFNKDYNDDLTLTDYYIGGWFDTFPTCTLGGQYMNTELPIYGEVCYLPLDYSVVDDSEDEVTIEASCLTIRSPFYFTKTFKIKKEDATLYTETLIENISREKAYFNLAYHPNFGKAFIDHDIEIVLDECELEINHSEDNSRFDLGTNGTWPMLKSKQGKDIDLRYLPELDSGIIDMISLNNMKEARLSLRNRSRYLEFEMTWDLDMYRHTLLWIVRHGDNGYPRYGNTNVVCVMPRTTRYFTQKDCLENNDFVYIEAGSTIKTWMDFRLKDTNG